MIRTKQPKVINPQLGESAIIYFKTLVGISDYQNKTQHFNIGMFVKKQINGVDTFVSALPESMGTFNQSTFLSIFGDMTVTQFIDNLDSSLMAQIEYINNFQWSGEKTEKIIRFWDLTAADLEIVPENEMCPIQF